ncbi:homeobox protein CDX-1a [Sebastes umbrosus]|uniref:homeobox protein CDX-1a n=1 Tax=Sebastes umbrosus TaxID=72105 RepID=UPI00189DCF32|nr:homeobox protein CDX-1a [Sebastes umbrosus]XP_037635581.1 homeobox protein CDX-1a [Sebastes umbrosus]XP_037635582.1 homeobox protein CDX-1a [Sebastes umbrosus]XP_037635583.1 homeobox protein CDX-1a [Sebastes umbrosus]
MYPNSQSSRHPAQTLSLNSQYFPAPYDFTGYPHHVPGVGDSSWSSVYAPREEYPYGFPGSSPSAGQLSFSSPELSGPPVTAAGGAFNYMTGQDPFSSRRRNHEPIRPAVSGLKTRTKDKYRVVYTDQQRLELEKEFQFNRYITMRRKSELSLALGLSERQVKIWFQNRRAKERKITRKKLQNSQQASTTTPTPPALGGPADTHINTSPSSNILSDTISEEY